MDISKKQKKEHGIIDAAIKVFDNKGYQNARMEDIATEAGLTKVTLYSYFESKDNLYMAVTYRAFQALSEVFYTTIDQNKDQTGLRSTVSIFEAFFSFCEKNFLYSEALLDYFSLIRTLSREESNKKDVSSISKSSYFVRLQDLQNLPLILTVKEMERGIEDGSIKPDINCMLHTIQGWTMVVGYIKLLSATSKNPSPLLNVDLKSLKTLSLQLSERALAK